MRELDLEAMWPQHFAGLTVEERENVIQPLAVAWHEGWEPNERDTKLLCARSRGDLTHEDILALVSGQSASLGENE